MTLNAFSVYAASKKDNLPFFKDMLVLRAPQPTTATAATAVRCSGWLHHLQGRAERRPRQEARPRPARPGELQQDLCDRRRPVHAGLREPVDAGTDRRRPELRDHQGAGQRQRSVPRHLVAGEACRADRRDPRPERPRAGGWQRHLRPHERWPTRSRTLTTRSSRSSKKAASCSRSAGRSREGGPRPPSFRPLARHPYAARRTPPNGDCRWTVSLS